TLFNLGLTHHALGLTAQAMPFWQRSLERSRPNLSLVRKLYALLTKGHYQLGQRDEALTMCRTGLAIYPDDIELLSLEASFLSERGDLAGAEASLRRILQAPPIDYFAAGLDVGLRGYKTRYNLGRLYRAEKRDAEAEAQWQAALAERPEYAAVWLELGNLFLEQSRWADLGQAIEHLEPRAPEAAAQLRAMRHLARNEFAAACQVLEEAIARSPRTLELQILLSRALLREGRDWAAVERCLRGILTLDPCHLEARNNLTVLLRQ